MQWINKPSYTTDPPFEGQYTSHYEDGHYLCSTCHSPLFESRDKFSSHCGWPSFDDAIYGAIAAYLDPDGHRREVCCMHCDAHLGHQFFQEGFTKKNTRYCINSSALSFTTTAPFIPSIAYVAGGCFWGIDALYSKKEGITATLCGYMGGDTAYPNYTEVSAGHTHHAETVAIYYDPLSIHYKDILRYFFEIHDPTQHNHQGPDHGPQYRSVVFYQNDAEYKTATACMTELMDLGYAVATTCQPAHVFWKAEPYHQDYYQHNGQTPYCHQHTPRFPSST